MTVVPRNRLSAFINWLGSIPQSPGFPYLVLAAGILLRVIQYLHNRSLWGDEAALTANLLGRDYSGLLQSLDNAQGAPIGFLFIQRTLIILLGDSEYVLRLFPLLAGIASLFLFYVIARRVLSKWAIPLALVLFVLSDRLIYYSSEVKQYSSDVLIVLLIIAAALHWIDAPPTRRAWVVAALGGAALLWFSHPAALALAGIGLSLFVYSLATHKPQLTRHLVGIGVAWTLSLGINYFFSLRNLASNSYLLDFWQNGFIPLPPRSLSDLMWFYNTFFNVLEDPLMFTPSGAAVAALALITGGFALFARRRIVFFILIAPLLATLAAAGLHMYPFAGRLILFLIPCYLLFIAEGAEQIRATLWNAGTNTSNRTTLAAASITILVLLLFLPAKDALIHLSRPSEPLPGTSFGMEDMRPVAQYLADNRQPDDYIYVYYGALSLQHYYAERVGLSRDELHYGTSNRLNWRGYFDELDTLQGKQRVWVVFSHIWDWTGNERDLFLSYLNRMGKQLDAFEADGAAVYLYDLSMPEPSS